MPMGSKFALPCKRTLHDCKRKILRRYKKEMQIKARNEEGQGHTKKDEAFPAFVCIPSELATPPVCAKGFERFLDV